MRIHELLEGFPEGDDYVYICHAPDGHCRVLAADGGVYDTPEIGDPRNLTAAIGMLFDSHWRGANAQEIAAHPWNGPRVMRTVWTDEHGVSQGSGGPPKVNDAFVAVGSTRFSDGQVQTIATALVAEAAYEKQHPGTKFPAHPMLLDVKQGDDENTRRRDALLRGDPGDARN